MKKLFIILIFNMGWVDAQEYMTLTDDDLAYDVEIIVFARNLSQPNLSIVVNRSTEPVQLTKPLFINTEDLPLFEETPQIEIDELSELTDKNLQVPLGDDEVNMQALVWLFISQNMNHPIIERLNNNPTIKPLFHQKWRQPATEFLAPEYVAVSSIRSNHELWVNVPESEENQANNSIQNTAIQIDLIQNHTTYDNEYMPIDDFTVEVHPDFSFDGVVSFSKQRFNHLQVVMNFYRIDTEGQQLVYSINQKNRIEIGQWQYFDHQQFGVLAKVVTVENFQNEEAE